MIIEKKQIFIFFVFLIIIVLGVLVIFRLRPELKTELRPELTEECPLHIEEKIIRGNSLSPLIEDGQTVQALFGYYDCNEIKRDDIVLYSYPGREVPLIKIVRGVPDDEFQLQETAGGWHLLINGEILTNSENQPYLLGQAAYNMLSLYERDYQGIIPNNAFLILANLPGAGLDSTRFGLISRDSILAKAQLPE